MEYLRKIIILVFIFLIYPIQIYAFQVTVSPTQVESAENFEFVISMDESIYLANGHLMFNSELFTYDSIITPGVEVEKISENELAWIYTDLSDNPQGINNIKFRFIAKTVHSNITDNFILTDTIYINTNEKTYENNDITQPVTIFAKECIEIPATGGIGNIPYQILGIGLMVYSANLLKKNIKGNVKWFNV